MSGFPNKCIISEDEEKKFQTKIQSDECVLVRVCLLDEDKSTRFDIRVYHYDKMIDNTPRLKI